MSQEFIAQWGYWIDLLQDWGYILVFLGSMIEGESIIFLAGFLAQQGILSLPLIILISFVGTLVADQTLYHIGRHYGQSFFQKFPSFKDRIEKAFRLLRRYENLYILSFRFIYGIRIISPVVIGSSGVEPKRFIVLNFFAAIIWSVGSCIAAYYFADLMMDKLALIPKIMLGVLVLGGSIGYGVYRWRTR